MFLGEGLWREALGRAGIVDANLLLIAVRKLYGKCWGLWRRGRIPQRAYSKNLPMIFYSYY